MALMKTHGSKAIVALIAIGVSTALVACGGSKASGEDAQAKAEDAALDYAKCMREHGVDVPDPKPGGGGQGGFGIQIHSSDPQTNQNFQDAQDACGDILQKAIPEGDRPDPAEMRDKLHQMTECLRNKGYDVPEPQVFGPGDQPPDNPPAPDKHLQDLMNDPDFQQAQEDCSKSAGLPGGGPGIQVGPGPGGNSGGPSTSTGSDG
jgi:hypothetical protein